MKSAFDIIFSLSIIIILFPLMCILTLLVFYDVGKPILFVHKRPGLNNQPFNFYKFRTMSNKKDNKGNLLDDKNRVTKIGAFLRRTSLDELPSFINVLRGEMSIVGPRPLLMEYLDLYTDKQSRRHTIKPGVTGWAQINGRNSISWEEKFNFDIWYVDNQSLWIDIKILFLTILKVLKREGIEHRGKKTMPLFRGYGKKKS